MPGTAPNLHHEELFALFEHSLRIPQEKLHELLALPKETLVQDLHSILRYAAEILPQLKDEWDEDEIGWVDTTFALHAYFLLGELPGRASLEALLEFLGLPEEVLEFYLSDMLTEDAWEPICKLAPGNFDALEAFMRSTTAYTYARSAVGEAMRQLHFNTPALHGEVEQWFAAQLDFFIALEPEDPAMDFSVIALLVGDVQDMHLPHFLPRIEALYAREFVDPFDCATIEKIREELAGPKGYCFERPLFTIEARYAEFAALEERIERENEAAEMRIPDDLPPLSSPLQPIVRIEPKIGRNDPCPCGSGKKHKKCCLGA